MCRSIRKYVTLKKLDIDSYFGQRTTGIFYCVRAILPRLRVDMCVMKSRM